MKLLESRLAVAAPLIPLLYLLITAAPLPLFFIVVAAAILRAQFEFYKLYYTDQTPPTVYFGLTCGFFVIVGVSLLYRTPQWSVVLFFGVIMTILIFNLFFFREIRLALLDSAVLCAGVFYLAGFLGHLIAIRQLDGGESFIIFLLLVVWGNDAGAYYVGRSVGGKKLYPAISPGKTVSGSIGGFVIGGIVAALAKITLQLPFSWLEVILLSQVLVAFGQLGDLVESMCKRSAGVKDSGGLIPAHGGLFDKLDGVAFATPLLYYYLTL